MTDIKLEIQNSTLGSKTKLAKKDIIKERANHSPFEAATKKNVTEYEKQWNK